MAQLSFNDSGDIESSGQSEDWQKFLILLNNAFNEGWHQQLMELLLTPDERTTLATRVRIIQELMRGDMSQRELKSELGTGIATITRGANGLKMASPALKQWLKQQLVTEKA